MRRLLIFPFLIIAFSGCMIGPNYFRPKIDTPVAWRFEVKETRDLTNTAWWEQLHDPVLNQLIQTALQENKDLRIATARVDEFIGRFGTTRSNLFPQVGTDARGARERVTEKGYAPLSPSIDPIHRSYEGIISAGWEIDVWGRLRRSTEAACAELLGSEEGRRTVILTLVTAVANAYIELRSLDRQLEIAKSTATTREGSYKLFKMRFEQGIISELELSQVQSQYEEALATIPAFEKFIAQQEDALSILLGQNPREIPRGKNIDQLVLPGVPAGVPSAILERRPDILQAEQDLIAANARIGVARSLYFPTISLTGDWGSASAALNDLFSGSSHIWSYAVQSSMPIFTAGGIAGLVTSAKAIQQQTLARYQQVIQNAFREVDDALIDQQKTGERLQAQARQVEALRTYARMARLRFDEGYTSYIEVLDAERTLFNVELSYTQTHGDLFRALINLYKAMGGGWITRADSIASGTEAAKAPVKK
jgi:outer membrane protein, multidrug efflux system